MRSLQVVSRAVAVVVVRRTRHRLRVRRLRLRGKTRSPLFQNGWVLGEWGGRREEVEKQRQSQRQQQQLAPTRKLLSALRRDCCVNWGEGVEWF